MRNMGKMGGKWGQRPWENGDSAGKMGTAPGKWGQRPIFRRKNRALSPFSPFSQGCCPHFPMER